MRFRNRTDAGRQLAERLARYADRSDVIVLGLPRGGIPVAHEIANRLKAPLDVLLVRKLGVPGHAELAMGAIAAGGVRVLNGYIVRELNIPSALIDQVTARERLELDRRDVMYRATPEFPAVRNRIAIVVDDGLATGATMEAAILVLRHHEPARIVVAVPVGARETCARLGRMADEVVCLTMPEPFNAVGLWYDDFSQTADEEVIRLLHPPGTVDELDPPAGDVAAVLRQRAVPLTGDPHQYDSLIGAIGDARIVLLGEATHGTHEFYRERAFITRRLIEEKGFSAVAVEADWPDAYRVNRYVRASSGDEEAVQSLADFGRFPTWMWRNADVLDFVGWLRTHNDIQPSERRAGFYGLDLYSLHASMHAVLGYLDKVDPVAAARARRRYACFDVFGAEMQQYGYAAALGLSRSCEREVLAQLVDLHQQRAAYATRDGRVAADDYFFAEQNARLVRNAEEYYRTMFRGHADSWNLRDRHMADTLRELTRFLERSPAGAKVVVWAHNSHLGDARATEMHERGELNLGQLVRMQYGDSARLVGFTTYDGTVTAASAWDGPAHRKQVRPGVPGSYERLFHEVGMGRFLLPLCTDRMLADALKEPRLERAIGVLYLPESERTSHYFHARIAEQFDFILHFDRTRAVEPLERDALWDAGEVAETFPSGL